MIEQTFQITWPHGLAECSSPLLAKTAGQFRCRIKAEREEVEVNCKSLFGLMLLAADHGSEIRIRASGHDEREAISAILDLFETTFSRSNWAC